MIEEGGLLETLMRKKVFDILIYVNLHPGDYLSNIAKITNTTYAHCIRLMRKLVDLKLIRRAGSGRKVNIYLTHKGKEFADVLQQLINLERKYTMR